MSVFSGCSFVDEAQEALAAFNLDLTTARTDFETQLASTAALLTELTTAETAASRTVGVGADDNVITWTAVTPGSAGTAISVTYLYQGPEVVLGVFNPRAPSAQVVDQAIFLKLGCTAGGVTTPDTTGHLAVWGTDPTVAALISGVVVGTGLGLPTPTGVLYLQGGKDSPVTDAETAGHEIAKVFGRNSYQNLMRDLGVPIIETDADATAFLQGEKQILVNGHILVVDGTNLTGLNELWALYGDVVKIKSFVAKMQNNLPTLLTTQNTTATHYETICNQVTPISVVTEVVRDINRPIGASVNQWGDYSTLNHYVFWGVKPTVSRSSYTKLSVWDIPDNYIGDILAGEEATASGDRVTPPKSYTVEDLALMTELGFTNAELAELFALNVPGVKLPKKLSQADLSAALAGMLRKPKTMANGLLSNAKAPLAAARVVNIPDALRDTDSTKELATRGKACARLTVRLPNMPLPPDLPNVNFPNLPDPAKKIESAFGALSSAIAAANRVFDGMLGGIKDMVMGILDKIQNLMSLAENLVKNPITECLLGSGTKATGVPEYTGPSSPNPSGSSVPKLESLTGGLPIPMSLLEAAFRKMSVTLDQAITKAFAVMMEMIKRPLCMVQSMVSTTLGISLGGLTNPCASGKDNCPAEAVQQVIDGSTDMTAQLATIPSLEDAPTTDPVTTVTETVENYTGKVQKTVATTQETVTRGVKQVMEDIQKSLDSKMSLVNDLDKAIRELFGDVGKTANSLAEASSKQNGCASPGVGSMTDMVMQYV
jgi:uncharacterized protein YoxC